MRGGVTLWGWLLESGSSGSNEGRHTAHLGDEPQKGVKLAAFRSPLIVLPPRRVSLAGVTLGTIKTDSPYRFLLERSAAKDAGHIHVQRSSHSRADNDLGNAFAAQTRSI